MVEEYTGHGIGTAMHMDPPVPVPAGPAAALGCVAGMALAIEPMVMLGGSDTVLLDDDWTVVTADGSWAAHFEHTVAITPRRTLGADRRGRRPGRLRRVGSSRERARRG